LEHIYTIINVPFYAYIIKITGNVNCVATDIIGQFLFNLCNEPVNLRDVIYCRSECTCIFSLYILANGLLRLATDGKIVMCLYPPEFTSKQGMKWLYFKLYG
jgi:hypothetical protein